MELFYNPTLTEATKSIQLDVQESGHLAKVLRKKEGDLICLTNGKGLEWKGKLTLVNPRACEVICEHVKTHNKPKFKLHLAVAPTKNIQRLEWVLEKATEIGVTHFTPMLCEHAERKVIKPERLEKIIITAMKQSQQFYLPHLNPLTSFEEVLVSDPKTKFIAHCKAGSKVLLDAVQLPKDCVETSILIGPEGDFSKEEIQMALDKDFQAVQLSKNRLRTETAALMAAHSLLIKLNKQL